MEIKKIVAIVRSSVLEKVEERLRQIGVKGVTVSRIKGLGEYANLFKEDRMVDHVCIAIFAEQSTVDSIVKAIIDSAHLGIPGDGIVAVQPVDKLYRIRTKAEIELHEC
ncbi:MAG: P-II family nitrogen regulator [Pedobacter sp.]